MLRKGGEKMSNEWLTINELSGRLKVSIKTVRNRMADGYSFIISSILNAASSNSWGWMSKYKASWTYEIPFDFILFSLK